MHKNSFKPLAWTAWAFFLGAVFIGNLNNGYNFRFNADEMYFPNLFLDLFHRGFSLSDWTLQPAPSYFPSMFVYFATEYLTRDPVVSLFIMASLQQIFTLICLQGILHLLWPKLRDTLNFAVPAIFGLFILAVAEDIIYIPIFASGTHYSSVAMAIFAVYLSLRILKAPTVTWGVPVCLLLTISLTAPSDAIFTLSYTYPMLCTLVFGLMFTKISRAPQFLIGAVCLVGLVSGWVVEKVIVDRHDPFPIDLSVSKAVDSWPMLVQVMQEFWKVKHLPFTILYGLSFLFVAVFTVQTLFRRGRGEKSEARLLIAVFYFVLLGGTLVAGLASGTFLGMSTFGRHFILPIMLPVFVLPILMLTALEQVSKKPYPKAAIIAVVALLGLGAAARFPYDDTKTFFNHYPEEAACIDKYAEEYGLQRGIGDYWNAKTARVLSKKNVPVLQVGGDARPYLYINNEAEYNKDQRPINFLLTNKMDLAKIEKVYGPASHKLPCGSHSLWVYDPSTLFYKTLHKNLAHTRYLADINGDQYSDVITLSNRDVRVTLGGEKGLQKPTVWWNDRYRGNRADVVGDINNDGRADLIAINHDIIGVLLSQGNDLAPLRIWYHGKIPGYITTVVHDADLDGFNDIGVFQQTHYRWFKSSGSHLEAAVMGPWPEEIIPKKGLPIVVKGHSGNPNQLFVISNGFIFSTRWQNGDLISSEKVFQLPFDQPSSPDEMRASDINNDGYIDMVAVGRSFVIMGGADGFFAQVRNDGTSHSRF